MRAIIKARLEREAGLSMIVKKRSKRDLFRAVFGIFFVVIGMVVGLMSPVVNTGDVYADEETSETTETENNEGNTDNGESGEEGSGDQSSSSTTLSATGDSCKNSLGEISWLVCPVTGKIAEAVDWLYGKLEGILEIDPVSMEDGSPIYEIWKYCLSLTNIVFVIFLLVVIYSQITGVGISNYGLKKALPKLIVAAVLVNLSFLICSLAVDVSNIVGHSLRGVFTTIEESVVANSAGGGMTTATGDLTAEAKLSYAGMYSSIAGGAALTIGGAVIAFETGAIWMLIPVVLGAIVAVASGLITIALRQAVVVLLIMISPMAIVAYILPNTEQWYKKWKDLFIKMLVFYPMFSLLFGASSLAGFAIIASAKDGFGVLLGTAVQIFPLFFSWSLMKMSGTFLGTINAKMRGLAEKPLATNRAWADSHRMATKQKYLSSGRASTPSLRLMQFVSDRRIAREAMIDERSAAAKERGLAYRARRNYKNGDVESGILSKKGEEAYERQARVMGYQRTSLRDKNNFNKGFSYLAAEGTSRHKRLYNLDMANVNAADMLKVEQARGEKIEYENAVGLHKRMEDAINVHMDDINGYTTDTNTGQKVKRGDYEFHFADTQAGAEARARYSAMSKIMEGNAQDVQYAAATAAHAYDTQKKIVETKMQKYFELTPPTKDVEYRLSEFTKDSSAIQNIDQIIAGMRILNQRGDTDLVREQLENVLSHGVDLGSHASQSLASFLMFEVKDNDPFLRRFGKYINLETAQVYNKSKRKNHTLTLDEYVTGEYEEEDPSNPGVMVKRQAKRPMAVLMEGTSLDNIERTAMKNLDDMLVGAYSDKDGNLDVRRYLAQRDKIETAIGPQFISASLKYLSGSEQLKSMVSFLTGYDGSGNARWADGGDLSGDAAFAEEYFRGKTLKYLKDQTPTQLLGLRSDYYNPLMEHLAKEYEGSDMKGWSDEAKEERREYMAELADIQTRYGDLPAEKAQERRAADLKKLRNSMAGAQFRQLLDSRGKLNQIYRTRRSGAANNAKDWVREWLDLDNEVLITMKLEEDKRRMKTEVEEERRKKGIEKKSGSDTPEEVEGHSGIYSDVDRAGFVSHIDDLWNNLREEDDEVFYRESLEYINQNLGEDSFIAAMYKHFRKNDPYADSHAMKEFLEDLLNDPDNY